MSYPFIATGANTKLIFQLAKEYLDSYNHNLEEARKMSLSPDYTYDEFLDRQNTAYSCLYVYNELSKINREQFITASKLQELKESFVSYNDPKLLELLDTAFEYPKPATIASPRPRAFTPHFFQKASKLERRAIEQSRQRRSPLGEENVGSSSPASSSSNQDAPLMTVCKSPRLTSTREE